MDENVKNVVEKQEGKVKKFLKKAKDVGVKVVRIATPIATALNTVFLVSCCVSAAKDSRTNFSNHKSNESLEVKQVNTMESSVG